MIMAKMSTLKLPGVAEPYDIYDDSAVHTDEEVALKSDIDQLTEVVNGLRYVPMIYLAAPTYTSYACNCTYEKLYNAPYSAMKVMYYDTVTVVSGEVSRGNYMSALHVRHTTNPNDNTGYFEFTFFNHARDGYIILRLNSDNTITAVST